MSITIENHNNTSIVKVLPPIHFAVKEVEVFRKQLYSYMDEGKYKFIFDFTNCEFIDSTGLGLLVSMYKRCLENKGFIKLCSLNAPVYKVIDLTRLSKVFDIYSTCQEACKSI